MNTEEDMKIYPIYHSGFMVELQDHILLFDYYQKELPITTSSKPLYVFVSHKHADHYNPEVFDLTKGFHKRYFIFASEIKDQHENIIFMHHDETKQVDDVKVSTLLSTDSGVAFIIEVENLKIYHAGDLHLWLWDDDTEKEAKMMKGSFMAEMRKIKNMHFDLAFLVLDSRQDEKYAMQGIDIFNEMTDTSIIFPMHYSSDPALMEKRLLKLKYNTNIVNTERVKCYEV